MKKNTIVYLLIVFLAIANIFLMVNYLGHPKGKKGGNPGDFVAKELKFDDSQMQQFKTLNDNHEVEMRAIAGHAKKLKGSLFTKISEENVSSNTIDSIITLIGAYESKRDLKTYKHFREIQEICTDEQKERFNSIVKQALKKVGGSRHKK